MLSRISLRAFAFAALVTLFLIPRTASADLKTFQFSGSISGASWVSGTVFGTFSYDTSVADSEPGNPSLGKYVHTSTSTSPSDARLVLKIAFDYYRGDPNAPNTPPYTVFVENNPAGDSVRIRCENTTLRRESFFYDRIVWPFLLSDPLNVTGQTMELTLKGPAETLSSDSLSDLPLLAVWREATLRITGHDNDDNSDYDFQVDIPMDLTQPGLVQQIVPTTSIPFGLTVGHIAVNRATNRVYVAAPAENKVYVLHGDANDSNRPLNSKIYAEGIPVGGCPIGLAVDRGDSNSNLPRDSRVFVLLQSINGEVSTGTEY